MKHLRKAFSNHRLIRTTPEGSQDPLSAELTGDSVPIATGTITEHPPSWRRRKPSYPTAEVETVPEFITLWDESDRKLDKASNKSPQVYNKKI